MPLIVEDGTGLNNSETLISEANFIIFCAKRGITITDANQASVLLIKAMDLINTYESDFQGSRTIETQALPFPRIGMVLDDIKPDIIFPSNEIPKTAIWAQCHAAIAAFEGVDLLPVQQNGKVLIRKKVAIVEKEWAYDPTQTTVPTLPLVDSCLAPILRDGGAIGYVTVYRA